MQFSTILSLATTFTVIGLVLTFLALALFMLGYSLIYRKLLKGQKKLSVRKLVWWYVFLCYCFVVLAATLLMRGPAYEWGEHLYPLFYSYYEAWTTGSEGSWLNIFYNYCMFMPMGFLLALGWERYRHFYSILLFGLGFSYLIESLQFITRRGMFEADDLLGNTLGALIGYGIYCLLHKLFTRKSRQPKTEDPKMTVRQIYPVRSSGLRARKAQ